MNALGYIFLFGLLLMSLLGSLAQMSHALDEIDIERFCLWTCVASIIAGLPTFLL